MKEIREWADVKNKKNITHKEDYISKNTHFRCFLKDPDDTKKNDES